MKHLNVFIKRYFESRKRRILVPGILLSLVISACIATPASTPTDSSTIGSSPSVDARTAVLHAIQAHLTAGPYRVVASTTSGTTTTMMHGEVILPDRFHLFMSISGGAEREYIIIGSATYAKEGDQWLQLQIDLSGLLANFIDRLDPDAISDVRLVGPEEVNGTPALAYTYTYTSTIEGTLITNHDEMWVGVDNGLPIKQVIDGELNGTVYHMEQTIEYDASIIIEAPSIS
jgi:hypothetical protein